MTRLRRIYFLLTGRCIRYTPGKDGVCVVCRIAGAGMSS